MQFEIKSFVLANQTVSSNFSFLLLLLLFSLALFRAKRKKKRFFSRETVICSSICWISTLFNKRSNQWTATKDFSKLSYSSLFCCWMKSFFCSAHHHNTKSKVKTKIKAKRKKSFRFFIVRSQQSLIAKRVKVFIHTSFKILCIKVLSLSHFQLLE